MSTIRPAEKLLPRALKRLAKMTLLLLFGIIVGIAAMAAVYTLPVEPMYEHAKSSADMYRISPPTWGGESLHTNPDTFSESVMVMTAIHPRTDSVIFDAMTNARWNHFADPDDTYKEPTRYMVKMFDRNQTDDEFTPIRYGRYWHGYLVVMKPLLTVMKLSSMRILNSYLQFLLTAALLLTLFKRFGAWHTFAFALMFLTINPVTAAISFQNSAMFYITVATAFAVLKFDAFLSAQNLYPYACLVLGIATAFFDLWTYPIVPLGVALVLIFLSDGGKTYIGKCSLWLKKFGDAVFSWGFGYCGMWAGKLAACYILADKNIINDTIGYVYSDGNFINSLRGAMDASKHAALEQIPMTPLSAIMRNFQVLWNDPVNIIFIIFIIIMLFVFVTRGGITPRTADFVAFGSVFLLPVGFYALFYSHCFMHVFFTYRNLAVSVLAFACLLLSLRNDTL